MPRTIAINGQWGLGDNIYARPFIKRAAKEYQEVFLDTPWPQLYQDIAGVRFIRKPRGLRTQTKNVEQLPDYFWTPKPQTAMMSIQTGYSSEELLEGSITQALENKFGKGFLGVGPVEMDLPASMMQPLPQLIQIRDPVAVIRPVTERREWLNTARNPIPGYIQAISKELMKTHHVIVLADLQKGEEWVNGEMPTAHKYLTSGELGFVDLMRLVANVDIVVGPVGWIVPAALATKTPTFIVLGGQLGHNSPSTLIDPRIKADHVGFSWPDEPCHCSSMVHKCKKITSNLMDQWTTWRATIGDGVTFRSPPRP